MHVNNVKLGHRNKQSYANTRTTGKEQYYTKESVVDLCISQVLKAVPDIDSRTILEPCGGTGEFIEGLLRAGIDKSRIISYDIEPAHPMVLKGDYLEQNFHDLRKSFHGLVSICLLYTSPSPRDVEESRMPSCA